MTTAAVSDKELLLLRAALDPDPESAADAWRQWASSSVLEEAPYPELRMLPAVHAKLSRVAPDLVLPQKLRGKARATFTRNQLLAHGSLPLLTALAREMPVMLLKGAAFCTRFNAWSLRAMGDIDVLLAADSLPRACEIMREQGWAPKYGMTWASLSHRSSLRRNSWNIAKGNADVDIHWRTMDSDADALLADMWADAQPAKYFGLDVLLPSPEFAVAGSLRHGFEDGSHGDWLQTALDVSALLPLCDGEKLSGLLTRSGLWRARGQLARILQEAGFPVALPKRPWRTLVSCLRLTPQRKSLPPESRVERELLHDPRLYRWWERLGRPAWLERWCLGNFGPFSKPLAATRVNRRDYDLRECRVIDEVAGPGWGWPEPEHTCFWTDRADSRLLLPLESPADLVAVLTVSNQRHHSPNSRVMVFANGKCVSTLDLAGGRKRSEYVFFIPRRLLFGPWVELSFRPMPYRGNMHKTADYEGRRSIPVARLRLLDSEQLAGAMISSVVSPLSLRLLAGAEPQTSKFARIKQKMEQSAFKTDLRLPPDFDPIFYVLWYDDIFAAEVDPYEHFLSSGRNEGRSWR